MSVDVMFSLPARTHANPPASAILETPVNTVAPRGGQMRAFCLSSDPSDRIFFRHYRKSTTVTIFDNGTVSTLGQTSAQSNYASRYDVTYETVESLPILRRAVFEISFADFDDAGTHSCQSERNGTVYYFEVIVLGKCVCLMVQCTSSISYVHWPC